MTSQKYLDFPGGDKIFAAFPRSALAKNHCHWTVTFCPNGQRFAAGDLGGGASFAKSSLARHEGRNFTLSVLSNAVYEREGWETWTQHSECKPHPVAWKSSFGGLST